MKKTLILAGIFALALSSQTFAQEADTTLPAKAETTSGREFPPPPPPQGDLGEFQRPPMAKDGNFEKNKNDFEKRLKLTDEQKAKAKEIREQGHKELKSVMDEIKIKRDEINKIENSFNTDADKKAKIEPLRAEVRELNKKAHGLKIQNMKNFEEILTEKQLKTLKKMKNEGRKKFEKNMKKNKNGRNPGFSAPPQGRPPFEGFKPHNPGEFPPPPPPKAE